MQVIFNTLFMLEAIQVYIYDSKKRYQQEKRMRRTLATEPIDSFQ